MQQLQQYELKLKTTPKAQPIINKPFMSLKTQFSQSSLLQKETQPETLKKSQNTTTNIPDYLMSNVPTKLKVSKTEHTQNSGQQSIQAQNQMSSSFIETLQSLQRPPQSDQLKKPLYRFNHDFLSSSFDNNPYKSSFKLKPVNSKDDLKRTYYLDERESLQTQMRKDLINQLKLNKDLFNLNDSNYRRHQTSHENRQQLLKKTNTFGGLKSSNAARQQKQIQTYERRPIYPLSSLVQIQPHRTWPQKITHQIIIDQMQQSQIFLLNDECIPTEMFENQEIEALVCPIGLGIVNNPVFDPCGHVFCKGCIVKWLNKNPKCPVNNQALSPDQLVPALSVRNLIGNLTLNNCFQQCGWKGKLESYPNHQSNQCPEELIRCICQETFKRRDYQDHFQNCPSRLVECEFCKSEVLVNDAQLHESECLMREVECELCNQKMKRGVLNIHKGNDCIERIVECSVVGCQDRFPFKLNDDHMNQTKHIGLLWEQLDSLKRQLHEVERENLHLKTTLAKKGDPPFLDGWSMKFKKSQPGREWVSINSMRKVGSNFVVKFLVQDLASVSNSWRGVIGISSKRLKEYFWYKTENTFVWIMGGLKCRGKSTPEPYGKAFDGTFTVTMSMIGDKLIFDVNDATLGNAFVIPKEVVDEGFYIMISLINTGKVRILEYMKLN